MKTFTLTIVVAALMWGTTSKAQDRVAFSARYGINTKAITGLIKLQNDNAIEAIFSVGHDHKRVLLTGLYEEFYSIGNSERLFWYLGAGLHAGYNRNVSYNLVEVTNTKFQEVPQYEMRKSVAKEYLAGADAIIGLTYYIPNTKFTIGIDAKPNVDFINNHSMLVDGGIRLGVAF